MSVLPERSPKNERSYVLNLGLHKPMGHSVLFLSDIEWINTVFFLLELSLGYWVLMFLISTMAVVFLFNVGDYSDPRQGPDRGLINTDLSVAFFLSLCLKTRISLSSAF